MSALWLRTISEGPQAEAEREEINHMLHVRGYSPPPRKGFQGVESPELFALSPQMKRQDRTATAEKTSQISLPTIKRPQVEKAPPKDADAARIAQVQAERNAAMVRSHIFATMQEQRAERAQQEAVRTYIRRVKQLDELGIFDAHTNRLRARCVATTEMIRKESSPDLSQNNSSRSPGAPSAKSLNAAEEAAGPSSNSLEFKLERMYERVRATDPPAANPLCWNGVLGGSRKGLGGVVGAMKGRRMSKAFVDNLKMSKSAPTLPQSGPS
mmetsp:Transcript_6736/g.17623  ORF Transcript_6736/g.17623 Transcript_6736/m.17623 type:complete len:269 (-) Transcript_6736:87-893(-)